MEPICGRGRKGVKIVIFYDLHLNLAAPDDYASHGLYGGFGGAVAGFLAHAVGNEEYVARLQFEVGAFSRQNSRDIDGDFVFLLIAAMRPEDPGVFR